MGGADAANILYTIGRFPEEPAQRAQRVAALRSLQDSGTGLFEEPTHHTIHTTAHCVAALELFDAKPAHNLSGLAQYADPKALRRFLADSTSGKSLARIVSRRRPLRGPRDRRRSRPRLAGRLFRLALGKHRSQDRLLGGTDLPARDA